jgi:xanthine dehydrogenase molybdenum-binding subunit
MARITGQEVYTADILPDHLGVTDLVYMGMVTCPYPRARITKIDVSKAVAAGYVTIEPSEIPPYSMYGISRPYSPLPIDGLTMYAGQPVVAVGAMDPNEVRDAINLVDVEYEPLEYVFDAEAALQPGAPQLWENGNSPAASVVYHYPCLIDFEHCAWGLCHGPGTGGPGRNGDTDMGTCSAFRDGAGHGSCLVD